MIVPPKSTLEAVTNALYSHLEAIDRRYNSLLAARLEQRTLRIGSLEGPPATLPNTPTALELCGRHDHDRVAAVVAYCRVINTIVAGANVESPEL